MNHLLLLLPLLMPLYGAIFSLFFWRNVELQKVFALQSQVATLVSCILLFMAVEDKGILTTQVGNWPAPYGISLVADMFSCIILLAGSVTGFAVFMFSLQGLDFPRQAYGYYPLMLFLQLGVSGACLAGDLFNMFVWFEVLLICCFVLITLGGSRPQLEGSIKYVTINFLASSFLLAGIGIMYGLVGTLNLAEMALLVRILEGHESLITMAGMFFLVALGVKAAVFPLFFWLPASYHTPPIAISAFLAGLVTKVGVYALVRLFTLIFVLDTELTQLLLSVIAGLTMFIGVVGAAAQTDFRKILSFHIVSQIGYMIMGLAFFTPYAIAGLIFFMVHNILVKTNLFLISGVVARHYNSFALKDLGGVYLKQPFLALLFAISAFSLAGIPPLSGFWGKYMLAKAGLELKAYALVGVSLLVSLLTLFSMTKIWNEVFWKKKPDETEVALLSPITNRMLHMPVVMLVLFILFISLYAEPLVHLAYRAAIQLLDSDIYIRAVLYQ
ncbi:proton-conducting transporter membrane subunit [Pontibacter ruber]|uniref:Proton-conducting transporter membrane subunit n=1 Tax=Pontibacter ruber TaxID=1343895 RepID=A0ABW5CQW5_9BACT|nr:proton-conducting transporter membrane subunit [Pontibacter ruber]